MVMTTDGNILQVLARVYVDDLEAALPAYRALADGAEPRRFSFGAVELARVGPFLLLSGDVSAYRDRVATITVRALEPVLAALAAHGGTVLDGPAPGPNGRRLVARHADASVFEYIETGDPSAD
jgi:hypothetical protein